MSGSPTRERANSIPDIENFARQLDRISRVLLARVEGAAAVASQETIASPVVDAFGLTPLEADVLVLAAGAVLDADVRRLLAAAGGVRRTAPTIAGILSVLLREPANRLAARAVFHPHGALVRHGLIRLHELDVMDIEVTPTRRAIAALLGKHPLDDLPAWATVVIASEPVATWTAIDPDVAAHALHADEPPGAICVVRGDAGSGRTTWSQRVASPRCIVVDSPRALSADAGAELIELAMDCAIAAVPIVLDDADAFVARPELVSKLIALVDESTVSMVIVVASHTAIDPRLARRLLFDVTVPPPPPDVRRALWGDGAASTVEEIVLGPAQIANARRIVERAGVDPATAALVQIGGGHELLQPVASTLALSDLVVGADVIDELGDIIAAIRARGRVLHDWGLGGRTPRGRGISALFDGESGTGKTMACDVIAAEVRLPLMRVNVAALVDKYIGETEKNLGRVFAQARARGGILLFDEADALFGARVEVGRSQDRYANLETNLLLQLMEDYPGIVLLTTNLRRNMDQAFMRRITFKVYFELPDARQRMALWSRHLPPSHTNGLDVRTLAEKFELGGGAIKNVVMRACYRAAGEDRAVAMTDLVECARLETAASGKVAAW